MNIGDKVMIIEGSSDGYTGTVIELKPRGRIRVTRQDGMNVDVPFGSYVPLKDSNESIPPTNR